jgi:antitoxin component YwqK of YwqJK toxin-antitoxin module
MKKTLLIAVLFVTTICIGQTYEGMEFYVNGQPKSIKTYKESNEKFELVKSITLYENGQKSKEETYKNGKPNSKWTEWHSNGEKSKEGTYKGGAKNGNWTEWYNTGQKKIEVAYKGGNKDGLWSKWYDNGQKAKEGNYKYGEIAGVWTTWNKENQKIWSGTFENYLAEFIIGGRFNCLDGSKSIKESWVNDNDCDCNDCSDEPLRQPKY